MHKQNRKYKKKQRCFSIAQTLRNKNRSMHPGICVQGITFIYDKRLGPRGRFYGSGAQQMQETKKLQKPGQVYLVEAKNTQP